MPRYQPVAISLSGITVTDVEDDAAVDLGTLRGVHLVVLIRHRH